MSESNPPPTSPPERAPEPGPWVPPTSGYGSDDPTVVGPNGATDPAGAPHAEPDQQQ